MSRKNLKDVNMDAVMAYMIKNDCRLDEAIEAVSGGLSDRKRVVRKSRTTEKPKTKIKSARLKAGLSQSELALKADLNLRTLQAYEQGYKSFDNARLDVIFKVALLCECRLEDLIESPVLLELIKKYNQI